jgi:hypothetical protein
MDQDFQTSFIPKKPMIAEKHSVAPRTVSLLSIVAFFAFFAVLVITGALFLYKGVAAKNLSTMQNTLDQAKNQFEDTKIDELQALSRRLNAATDILANHIDVTPIFNALSEVTMKTVRYTKFSYALDAKNGNKITVNMSGQAVGYQSIALQSDLYSKEKSLIDPVFSNLSLDDNGNVLFDLSFSVDPSFVNYKKTLASGTASISPVPASGTDTTPVTAPAAPAPAPAPAASADTSNSAAPAQ